MKRRIRSSSASSRTRRARGAGGALEADEPANERVVARVGRVTVLCAQHLVEAMLGRCERLPQREAEPAKPRRSDRDQQGLLRFDPALEISNATADKVPSRKLLE